MKKFILLLIACLAVCCLGLSACGEKDCEENGKRHMYELIQEQQALCKSSGYRIYKCKECGKERKDMINSKGHDLKSETTPARCGKEGKVISQCQRSGCDYYNERTIPALSHNMTNKTTSNPTCTESGVRTYYCTREGCNYSYGIVVPALEHKFSSEITTQATCENKGEKTYSCTRENCKYTYTEEIEELKHDYNSEDTILPCVRDGLRTYICKRANCKHSYTEKITALGYHDCNVKGECNRCEEKNACSKYFGITSNRLVYNGSDENVIIPAMFNGEIITTLYSTFSNNTTIKTVSIPDTIENIGASCFLGCTRLISVELPSNLKRINAQAFYCSSLSSIYLPKTLEEIGDYAFFMCNNLDKVYYEGTEEEWYNIVVSGGNVKLFEAEIVFNYNGQA